MNRIDPSVPQDTRDRRNRRCYVAVTILLSLCVLANMILIFCMSAENPTDSGERSDGVTDVVVDVIYPDLEQRPPEEQESVFSSVHHAVRKLAHFSEFALLGFLSALLTAHLARRMIVLRRWLQWSMPAVFCLLYAISDEIHQKYTGRGPAVKDVLIDFCGALAGILMLRLLLWLVRHITRKMRTPQNKLKKKAGAL